ncbi:MAG: cytochrome c oxidase subunit II [Gammaproteobacteria bacterium]
MRKMQVAQGILLNFLLGSHRAYADSQFNLTEGVTPLSHDIYNLHMTIFWVCVAIGIGVFGVMIYSIIYHRKSKGAKAAHFHEHLWIEITWTVIPFLILVAMAIPATKVLIHMHDVDLPDINIKVTGYQWKWRYEYLDQGINFFSNNSTPYDQMHGTAKKDVNYLREVDHPVVVPIHKKIRFLITSNDVIHGWWVPDLGVKHDAIPGFIYESWARINRPGTYRGQCSKLCGVNHGFMPIVVIAMTEKDFANWVAVQKGGAPDVIPTAKAAVTPPAVVATPATASLQPATVAAKKYSKDELMKRGQQVYLGMCVTCHQADGAGMPPVFPALKGSKITTGPIAEHVATVLNGKPGTAMQAFRDQYSNDDLAAVITYERNALGNSVGDIVQPADIEAAKQKK